VKDEQMKAVLSPFCSRWRVFALHFAERGNEDGEKTVEERRGKVGARPEAV